VADSVTAFSAADLVALGAANIADLAAFTPNLEIVTAGATTPTFFIRGVGLNDFNANSTGAVAVYQDDVPVNAPALQLGTIFDPETVNILRGPQGTGLARNSSAGAIKLYGRKPTGQFNGYLRARAGNFRYQEYEGAIEAPIFEDMLSGRLAFIFTDRDGTMENGCGGAPVARVPAPTIAGLRQQRKTANDLPWSICGEKVTGGAISDVPAGLPKSTNDRHNWATRGTLLFEPTLDTSFLINGHLSRRNEFSRLGQSIGTNGG
jgi:iron complex outermembrane receptor protein